LAVDVFDAALHIDDLDEDADVQWITSFTCHIKKRFVFSHSTNFVAGEYANLGFTLDSQITPSGTDEWTVLSLQ
jgi:hypothetical protein